MDSVCGDLQSVLLRGTRNGGNRRGGEEAGDGDRTLKVARRGRRLSSSTVPCELGEKFAGLITSRRNQCAKREKDGSKKAIS